MKTLYVYDFDGTLFKSPERPTDWEESSWWTNIKSLLQCIPDNPSSKWWNTDLINKIRQHREDENAMVVIISGRVEKFRKIIKKLLDTQNISIDRIILKPEAAISTPQWKLKVLRNLIKTNNIERVEIWEDKKEDLKYFVETLRKEGISAFGHLVKIKAKPALC